jgi:hypothetical protein
MRGPFLLFQYSQDLTTLRGDKKLFSKGHSNIKIIQRVKKNFELKMKRKI